jgi:hypothetical protein
MMPLRIIRAPIVYVDDTQRPANCTLNATP